jgi:hypothetical protein
MDRDMKFYVSEDDGLVFLNFTDYGMSTKIVLTPDEARELGKRLNSVGVEEDVDLAAAVHFRECN